MNRSRAMTTFYRGKPLIEPGPPPKPEPTEHLEPGGARSVQGETREELSALPEVLALEVSLTPAMYRPAQPEMDSASLFSKLSGYRLRKAKRKRGSR